jgi:hypothetical protein
VTRGDLSGVEGECSTSPQLFMGRILCSSAPLLIPIGNLLVLLHHIAGRAGSHTHTQAVCADVALEMVLCAYVAAVDHGKDEGAAAVDHREDEGTAYAAEAALRVRCKTSVVYVAAVDHEDNGYVQAAEAEEGPAL